MYRFRLSTATIAVQYQNGSSKGIAIMIPAGSEVVTVDPIEPPDTFDPSKLATVNCGGTILRMFLFDLLERGERVDGAGA
jgi:hypothetical protein